MYIHPYGCNMMWYGKQFFVPDCKYDNFWTFCQKSVGIDSILVCVCVWGGLNPVSSGHWRKDSFFPLLHLLWFLFLELSLFDTKDQRFYSKLLILSLRLRSATLWRKIILATCIRNLSLPFHQSSSRVHFLPSDQLWIRSQISWIPSPLVIFPPTRRQNSNIFQQRVVALDLES